MHIRIDMNVLSAEIAFVSVNHGTLGSRSKPCLLPVYC
jgi:hypothetical protein